MGCNATYGRMRLIHRSLGPSENYNGNALGKVALVGVEEDKEGRRPERIEQIDLILPE